MMCKRIRYVGRIASTFRKREEPCKGEVKGEDEEANRTPIIKSPVAFHWKVFGREMIDLFYV